MAETSDSSSPQTVMDSMVAALKEGRNRSMQSRKAAIMKEFMIARRWIEETYKDFGPSDLPVDVHRVMRDLTVTRDQIQDAACAEVDKDYRITVQVLRTVAEHNPGYYSRAASEFREPSKGWRRPLPPVTAPKIAKVLPEKVLDGLTASLIHAVVARLQACPNGITFNELAKDVGVEKPDTLEQRNAVKAFCNFLRANDHVVTVGTGRGQRMKPTASLGRLREELVNESEA